MRIFRRASAHVRWAAALVLLMLGTSFSAAEGQVRPPRTPVIRPAPLQPATAAPVEPAKEYPRCTQDHAGRSYRTQRLVKDGDSEVLRSIAGHTVLYARERYGIADITTDEDYRRARTEMYHFLSWKLGNPALVAAQWVSAGYQHFDHHSDEAAAALLGMELPGPGPTVRLPKELTAWLKAQVDSLQRNGEGENVCASMSDSSFVGLGCEILLPFVQEAIERSIDRIGISSAALIGRNHFDVTDPEIELAIHVRRNPAPAPARGIQGIRKRPRSGTDSDGRPRRR